MNLIDIEGVPVVVSNHDEDVEILVIEIALKAMSMDMVHKKAHPKMK